MSVAPLRERLDDELDEELPVDEVPFESLDDELELDDDEEEESFLDLAFTTAPPPRRGDLSDATDAALAGAAATLAGDPASLDFLGGL